MLKRRELELLIGAVILPVVRPVGGMGIGTAERRPSREYMERFPPVGVIGFGRRLGDGKTIDGLEAVLGKLRLDAARDFFVCCDLERGAGYHLPGKILLPPARALAEAEAVMPGCLFEAGRLTGGEARRAGIDLVLGPVLDVNSNAANPIIGSRAFGVEPKFVARCAGEFLRGLEAAGAGSSLKHFPGHGDTAVDSHLELPQVLGSLADLELQELLPYTLLLKEALGAGTTAMVGHLDMPALTGEPGIPTSLAKGALDWLRRAGFEGAVLTDGLEMLAVVDLPELGVRCLEAGCDGLLGPRDAEAMALELLGAVESGRLALGDLERAAGRMGDLGAALGDRAAVDCGDSDGEWGLRVAVAALEAQAGFGEFRRALEGAREPRVGVIGPGMGASELENADVFVWMGTPESRPAELLGRPHVWAWAPGIVVEEALRRIIGDVELPRLAR